MPALVVDGRSGKEMFYNAVIAAITGWEDVRNDPLKAIRCGGGERRLDAEGCERRLFTAAGVGRYGDGEELDGEAVAALRSCMFWPGLWAQCRYYFRATVPSRVVSKRYSLFGLPKWHGEYRQLYQ